VDVEISMEYQADKELVVCKVRNKQDVMNKRMDNYFMVDIVRRYVGPQVEYTSSPEWFEIEGNHEKVTDINLVNALDQVHSRCKQKRTDECQYVKIQYQGA
jgi:hypothetical protein